MPTPPSSQPAPAKCPRCQERPPQPDAPLCEVCTVAERDGEGPASEPPAAAGTPPPKRGQPTAGPPQTRPSAGRAAHPDQARPAPSRHPNAPDDDRQPPPREGRQAPPPGAGQALDQRARPAGRSGPTSSVSAASMAPTSGPKDGPEKLVFYGPGGVGKTTLVADIPDAVLICVENSPGLTVARYADERSPKTLAEFMTIISYLRTAEHSYKTLAIDSADELEKLIFAACVQRSNDRNENGDLGAENIEHVGGGFKKGYAAARTRWFEILNGDLEQLRIQRRMRIVFTAHDVTAKKNNPAGDDFDQYALNLHPEAGRLELYNWADAVFFCNYITKTKRQGKRGKAKGIGGIERAMYTRNADAWMAKNRYDLPPQMPMSWDGLEARLEAWRSPIKLTEAINAMLTIVGDLVIDIDGKPYTIRDVTEWELQRQPSRQRLAQLRARLEARVADHEEQLDAEEAQREARTAGDAGGAEGAP